MSDSTTTNTAKNNSWPKQIYYYTILAGCILFLAIGSFTFLRANLVRYVFPESDYGYYPAYPSEQCKYKDSIYKPITAETTQTSTPVVNSPALNSEEERKACEQKLEDNRQKEVSRRYQQDMLNSILMLVVASGVLAGHVYTFSKLKI